MNSPEIAPQIWAKSKFGNQTKGESLDVHSGLVVRKFIELTCRTPDLPQWVNEPRLWQRGFWACFLHDFGKVAEGFQAQVREKDFWTHRHEVLSLAFLPWVISPESEDYIWAVAGIISHHRDALSGRKRGILDLYGDDDEDFINHLVNGDTGTNLKEQNIAGIIEILQARIPEFFQNPAYNLAGLGVVQHVQLPQPLDFKKFCSQATQTISQAVKAYDELFRKLNKLPSSDALNRQAIAIRGLVLLADRLASSHAQTIQLADLPDAPTLFARLEREYDGLRDHQAQAVTKTGSVILSAPTGSGKTEAALLWARRQQEISTRQPNLVYILPYQASLNAMHERLRRSLFEGKDSDPNALRVALMHGRSTQVLYRQLQTPGVTAKGAEKVARRAKDMQRLYQPSVWVTTPYQLLKAAYRLPGYEMLWTAIAGSRLIIDEVHAYEPERMGLFIGLLRHLKQEWAVQLCLMTATMPGWLRDLLQERLDIPLENLIVPGKELYEKYRRHQLKVKPGNLLNAMVLIEIVERFNHGELVLVCVNTVKEAQMVWTHLRERLAQQGTSPSKVRLLHSRFTGKDRRTLEEEIITLADAQKAKRDPLIVVATQVIEVSLDLDFNIIYTEPAPLEALAQRFGRVNRRRRQKLATVQVMTEPINAKANTAIYDPELVSRTQGLLVANDGAVLDEAQLNSWLDCVYANDLKQHYRERILQKEKDFQEVCLDSLRAFQSDESLESAFDKLFDGAEVVPQNQLNFYLEKLQNESALAASEYYVPISYRKYLELHKKGKLEERNIQVSQDSGETIKVSIVKLGYDEDTGLDLSDEVAT